MDSHRSTPETRSGTAHLNNIGRDEMNLAEFPLTTLADRAPRGCKTLVYEDRIWDRGQRKDIVRRLTISASDKYGLPTAIDDEVILGLVQVSKAAGFVDRRVRFSRYKLIHLLGWRDEGRSYRRLAESLKRWLGVTLYYENAWRDNAQKRWVDAAFHLLDDVVFYRRPEPWEVTSGKADDTTLSSFTWNEVVFRSFQAGFLKRLNLDLYRRLKLPTAKRMYRFLDKRLYRHREWRFKLVVFACTHIGVSPRYDAAQLKRRLNPAITELERAGFLMPLPAKERYRRVRRGEWEVVFKRTPKPRKPRQPVSDLEGRLIERGVTASSAAQLVRDFVPALIEGKIAVFDALRRQDDRRISRNPAGFLVQSIRKDYAPPAHLTPAASRPDVGPPGRRPSPKPRLRLEMCHVETSPAAAHLARLSAIERAEVETEAILQARGFSADRYRELTAAGNSQLAKHYLQIIVEQYLTEKIKADAAIAGSHVTQESN